MFSTAKAAGKWFSSPERRSVSAERGICSAASLTCSKAGGVNSVRHLRSRLEPGRSRDERAVSARRQAALTARRSTPDTRGVAPGNAAARERSTGSPADPDARPTR